MKDLNSKHIMFIIIATTTLACKTYPKIVSGKNNDSSSLIALIIASTIIVLFLFYIIGICKKHNCYDIYTIYTSSLGKFTGSIFLVFFAITLFLTLIECSSVSANALQSTLLYEVPTWYFLLFFTIASAYIIKKGQRSIISVTIVVIIIVCFSGIFLSISMSKYKKISNLLPIFSDGITIDFYISILKCLGTYGGLLIVFPYLKEVVMKKKLRKHMVFALLIVVQIIVVSAVGSYATLDVKRMKILSYPNIIRTELFDIVDFLDMGEYFVLGQFFMGWLLKYILSCFALLKILKSRHLDNKYNLYIINSSVFIISMFTSRDSLFLFKLLKYYNYIVLLNFILIPFILFTIFNIKNNLSTNS